ncbi:MAG: succinate-semialdehyde dehydrogenase/glutarate-semialdehyde dehydrogenase [Marinobacter psychrophilus]|jgi:succinate-semialdehyde dehydrogenase/glutarate-semialdehyde dehydrogenase
MCGGKAHALGGTFFEPSIIADATSDMRVAQEETFDPLAPVFRFDTDEQAIAMANVTNYGMAAYFYAKDCRRIWHVMEGLEYGMVAVNEGILSTELAPFDGAKESGLGREGSRHGLDEFTELKYVCVGGL